MNERLRRLIARVDELDPFIQEHIADILQRYFPDPALPPFDPSSVLQPDPATFDDEMDLLERIDKGLPDPQEVQRN